ncbi:hypothetical protein BAC_A0084 (plasmid) [Bacillus anthracis str. A0488]|nr:hypothetical protein BAMEG_A0159 [Bacillus anthracis str. CDC 684]ACQ51116.1 hypothetical protein BAA_A0167 [Bacillus anthracis str. A0248]AFH87020.1 Hypothetical Protein H9401_5635 [Bacillus anthracis str. H9401]AHK41778.1 hypothetical protein BAPAT_pXO10160 [Bacillus anthracis str. SVA11]EDR16368.1 hypothetical protein BAC_A0084 [Bacillus anthracis str. A0488]EDR85200.1 hypothetical protein BAQ_A0181 [Bacillus anthracis str. A0193]EDR90612.1 hypothetical protein BAH_A0119 [Bacillus anthr
MLKLEKIIKKQTYFLSGCFWVTKQKENMFQGTIIMVL